MSRHHVVGLGVDFGLLPFLRLHRHNTYDNEQDFFCYRMADIRE